MSPPLPSDIDFSVARDGELPIGTQLVWKLRSLIESGALEPRHRLPSLRTMAQGAGGRLTTTEELRDIRDGLSARLRTLDAERAEVLRQLAEIDQPAPDSEARRSTASLRGAKVRWVGA